MIIKEAGANPSDWYSNSVPDEETEENLSESGDIAASHLASLFIGGTNEERSNGGGESSRSAANDNHNPCGNNGTEEKDLTQMRVGVSHNGIAVDSGGFVAAEKATDLGFGIAQCSVRAASSLFFPSCGDAASAVNGVLDVAHAVTRGSITMSRSVTYSSLRASESLLYLTGAEKAESYRYVLSKMDIANETKKALEGLINLTTELGSDAAFSLLTPGMSPGQFVRGATALARRHGDERRARISSRSWARSSGSLLLPSLGSSELDSLRRYMQFSAAAYGARTAVFLGMVTASETKTAAPGARRPTLMQSNEDAIAVLTGITDQNDILVSFWGSELYRPGHFVVIDHRHREVVVAIRGTLSVHDLLVDLVCRGEELSLHVAENEGSKVVLGQAHAGFLKSAHRLAIELLPTVLLALDEHPDYDLVCTGHSSGGGVATVLALIWSQLNVFKKPESNNNNSNDYVLSAVTRTSGSREGRVRLSAVSLAAPCCVSANISQHPFTRDRVTSVVFGDDMVSRLSLANVKQLHRSLLASSLENIGSGTGDNSGNINHQAPPQRREESESESDGDNEKLYCGGRVWWLGSPEYRTATGAVEIDPVQELHSLELFPDMFSVHLPNAGLSALDKLCVGSESVN